MNHSYRVYTWSRLAAGRIYISILGYLVSWVWMQVTRPQLNFMGMLQSIMSYAVTINPVTSDGVINDAEAATVTIAGTTSVLANTVTLRKRRFNPFVVITNDLAAVVCSLVGWLEIGRAHV